MTHPVPLPPPVTPGDRVGVAALSGPVDPDRLARGLAALGRLGFEAVPAANLGARAGLFAGADDDRLGAFHELAADPSLRAIFFARGGHGLLRLLPRLDWSLLERHPRAYVGYSDVVPFLLEVVRRVGVAAFHGPMVAADLARGLSEVEEESLLGALAGRLPAVLPLAGALGEEEVTGPLTGGCLSMLLATLGTPFAPDLSGSILFWEDVNEPLYRLDRMLTQLSLSNSLAAIRGMVVGQVNGQTDLDETSLGEWLGEVRGATGGSWPVGWGLAAGHGPPNRTLPLGVAARLEPARRRLVLG